MDLEYLVRVYRITDSAIRRLKERHVSKVYQALKMHEDVLKETQNTLKTNRKKRLATLLSEESTFLNGQNPFIPIDDVRAKIAKELEVKPRRTR